MIEKLWELLTTITPESQNNVINKCIEFGFNTTSRGVVSLEESYINLNASALLLKDLIEKKKLIQLPITIQKVLIDALQNIINAQTGIVAGGDAVENLSTYIESLNTQIWQYGLHNLSDEVLGYQTKMNQIKSLELEVGRLRKELVAGIKSIEILDALIKQSSVTSNVITTYNAEAEALLIQIKQNVQEVTTNAQSVAAYFTQVQQNDTAIAQIRANANQSSAEIVVLESKATEFFGEVSNFTKRVDVLTKKAEDSVELNTKETTTLKEKLVKLEVQIKDQLEKATGYSLFHSFQTRQGLMVKSKNFWLLVLSVLLLIAVGLGCWLVKSMSGMSLDSIGVAFYLKLSLTIPLLFAISFSTIQYSRERRLEEEYAFKSNISISLIPYQELVEKLVDEDDQEQRKEYATFIISTINKIFTSPTNEIFKDKKSSKGMIDENSLKIISQIGDAFSKFKPPSA
ncbi:MAG: hypothetical protein HOO90_01055 [Methylotenera sp.]|uniref:hypothetical protein n=1 Tax=Methylotenera sp. TaxID=2051956 RepID=UPI0017C5E33B|nr:hypothetical protein [Methylotenera sp.]NOU24104.1 hypothetical protein [Methylotenera sp.]